MYLLLLFPFLPPSDLLSVPTFSSLISFLCALLRPDTTKVPSKEEEEEGDLPLFLQQTQKDPKRVTLLVCSLSSLP